MGEGGLILCCDCNPQLDDALDTTNVFCCANEKNDLESDGGEASELEEVRKETDCLLEEVEILKQEL